MTTRARRGALTLIEVMFSIGLFAAVSTALVAVWVTHYRALDQSQNLLAATSIAEGLLAQQAGLAFKAKSDVGNTTLTRSMDGADTDYTYKWVVTVTDTTVASPDIKRVSVTVTWPENNSTKSVTMVTCVYWQG